MKELFNWNIYEITTQESTIKGVMLRGRIRKFALENNINLLTENATDKENCVRFAILDATQSKQVTDFIKTFISDADIVLNEEQVKNPVLSKMKVNKEERYILPTQKVILVDAVNTFVDKETGMFQEMYELLEQYPNKKIVLTNADDEQMEKFGLNDLPYEVFTLKHNPNKPDPVYFETMLRHFDLKADNVIYFEHNEDAVKSAQSVGITTYHYNPEVKDLERLQDFIESNL